MSHQKETFERLYGLFRNCGNPDEKERENGWSVREILGHMVDSASNNHQRFVRYDTDGTLEFPAYDQNAFVERAGYDDYDYQELLELFKSYNLLILHMIGRIPCEALESKLKIGDGPVLTLKFIIDDYFRHMEVHEKQIKRIQVAG